LTLDPLFRTPTTPLASTPSAVAIAPAKAGKLARSRMGASASATFVLRESLSGC
jgi:hypothetical protein